jgi:hypothetical protein
MFSKKNSSPKASPPSPSPAAEEDGILQVANELEGDEEFAGGVATSSEHRNIKFKKAKKLAKRAALNTANYYNKLANETLTSRFVVRKKERKSCYVYFLTVVD